MEATGTARVINLWAGPGAGKSTTAAGLFFLMKTRRYKVELVTEYAKDLHYEGDFPSLKNQWSVTLEQARRQRRLRSKVDWIITDSPLPLALHYGKYTNADLDELEEYIKGEWNSYAGNASFFINRVKPYQPYGRRGSEDSARSVDVSLREIGERLNVPFVTVDGDEWAPQNILNAIEDKKVSFI